MKYLYNLLIHFQVTNLFCFQILGSWVKENFNYLTSYHNCQASLVAQMVKNLPTMQETWVWSLRRGDPLEEGIVTHKYSCLENVMNRGAWWPQSIVRQRVRHDWMATTHTHHNLHHTSSAPCNKTRDFILVLRYTICQVCRNYIRISNNS